MHWIRRLIRTNEFYSKICYFVVGALAGALAARDRIFSDRKLSILGLLHALYPSYHI